MKKIIIFFFIGILFFLQSVKIFALTEDEIKVEQNRVVAEMEEENKTEKWIYFFDSITKKIVKFFNYNDEFDSTTNPQVTKDWKIAVYSIWDSVFMKEFYKSSFQNDENLSVWDFWKINVNENSVKLFKTEILWETLILSWKDEEKFDWYLIQIKDKVDWFLDWNSKSLVYLLKKEFEDTDENKIKNQEIDKNFSDIKKNFLTWNKIFLTEKKFSDSELKIFLDENFFYAKIFWISNWEISTSSAQKILYWNTEILEPEKIWEIEKIRFPILIENYLKISDLFFTEKEDWDVFSWDFDWDEIFEKSWEEIFLPIQNDLWSFFINLKIRKKSWEEFIKKIQLNFFSPKIFFDKDENWRIFWHIEPKINNFPVFYTYENEDINKKFWSEKIFTNENWEFSFLKKSEKNSRKIFLENKNILWEIFLEKWNVDLKFSDYYWNFLVISKTTDSWKNIIAIIYFSWKIEIYDKNYQIILWENWKDFYLKKFWKKDFYFNFWVITD